MIPNDDNRGEDGINLRYYYSTEVNPGCNLDGLGPCRCLEMLIALAKRVEDELYGSIYNKTMEVLFWEMMENLGLSWYNDKRWYDSPDFPVDTILDRWLTRCYGRDGIGGYSLLRDL